MVKVALIGLGKMGISHCSIINTHPDAELVGVCDANSYVCDVLARYTGIRCYGDYREMVRETAPDALLVATPSRAHAEMVGFGLERGLHVFVEKPLALGLDEGERLVELADRKGVVNQVGYHYRFVESFRETRRILDAGLLGDIHNFRVEAYGPVVLKPRGSTWRSDRAEGGGCLFDYASHAIDLANFLFGPPTGVGGTVLNRIFSRGVEDEVYATLYYRNGRSGQLCANWSDDTHRKMSMKIAIWGTNGRIVADRQECQIHLRSAPAGYPGLQAGWNTRYTTDLTRPVWFYLRGEEYSWQLDHFVRCIEDGRKVTESSFASALQTDRVIQMLVDDAERGPGMRAADRPSADARAPGRFARFMRSIRAG